MRKISILIIVLILLIIIVGFLIYKRDNVPVPSNDLQSLCMNAGGNYVECGSKCEIMNQGKEGVVCPAMCESLCYCSGLAGFSCPEGYRCVMPENPGITDAFGYCELN